MTKAQLKNNPVLELRATYKAIEKTERKFERLNPLAAIPQARLLKKYKSLADRADKLFRQILPLATTRGV